jgi:hypothetical protein
MQETILTAEIRKGLTPNEVKNLRKSGLINILSKRIWEYSGLCKRTPIEFYRKICCR